MSQRKKTAGLRTAAAGAARSQTLDEHSTIESLREENRQLREEIETYRKAAKITADLVVEQIAKMEENYRELAKVNLELRAAMDEISTLRSTLPICAQCKSIRDDAGYWNRIEEYFEQHSTVDFTHGLCPDCEAELYGEEDWYQKRKEAKDCE